MASPYTRVTIVNFNASPPSDDGSQVASNQLDWDAHLDKLAQPLKTAIEAIDANVHSAINTCVIRSIHLKFEPGATPGTDIDITDRSDNASKGYNAPAITDAIDLAASGSVGSFALSANGDTVTMTLTENIIGILSYSIAIHDINSSSTTEMYTPFVDQPASAGTGIDISLVKRGSIGRVDWRTIMDAGDRVVMQISIVTST